MKVKKTKVSEQEDRWAELSDKLYVPAKFINYEIQSNLSQLFTKDISIYLPKSYCSQCYLGHEYAVPCEDGGVCPYKTKKLVMYDKSKLDGKSALGIWRGNIPLLQQIFQGFRVIDTRSKPTVTHSLEFTKKLRSYQKEAIIQWARARGNGIIEAPARSGKTVLGTYIISRLGLKTLLLCHQEELLDQFYETFENFTNLKEVSKLNNAPVVCLAKGGNITDLVKADVDVILSTYQTFISTYGATRLQKVKDSFGMLMVDECHTCGADKYSKVVSRINSVFRIGLTATPDRKDEMDVLAKFALGPVVAAVTPKQMTGQAKLIHTGFKPKNWSHWPTLINRISNSKTRDRLIINFVLKDLKTKRHLLLVVDRRKHALALKDRLDKKNVHSVVLMGGVRDSKNILKQARLGNIPVTIATRKKVRYGINVPIWDTYYCLTPLNNPPNFYQEFSRIRTPHKNKKEPLVRLFIDNSKTCMGCMNSCKKVLRQQGFTISKDTTTFLNRDKASDKGRKSSQWDRFGFLPEF